MRPVDGRRFWECGDRLHLGTYLLVCNIIDVRKRLHTPARTRIFSLLCSCRAFVIHEFGRDGRELPIQVIAAITQHNAVCLWAPILAPPCTRTTCCSMTTAALPTALQDIISPKFHQNNFSEESYIKNELGIKLDKGTRPSTSIGDRAYSSTLHRTSGADCPNECF